MPLIFEQEVDRIEFPEDGEWIEILRRLPYKALRTMTSSQAKLMQSGKDATGLMLLMITDWNLKGKNGEKAPISRESLDHMDTIQVGRIMEELHKRLPLKQVQG